MEENQSVQSRWDQACSLIDEDKEVEAFELFHQLADEGDAEAMFIIGCYYDDGIWIKKSMKKAVEYYQKSAALNCSGGQYNLGIHYLRGTGIEKNMVKAFELFQKASKQGHIDALFKLSECYREGKGVEKDLMKAKEYFLMASNSKAAEINFSVGLQFYEMQEYSRAKNWLQRAADKGIEEAQTFIEEKII